MSWFLGETSLLLGRLERDRNRPETNKAAVLNNTVMINPNSRMRIFHAPGGYHFRMRSSDSAFLAIFQHHWNIHELTSHQQKFYRSK
jgi:hypothetical protein